jgi:predicted nucleic acid-binding protein
MALILIDTNVIVYACDPSEPAKRDQAGSILRELAEAGAGWRAVPRRVRICDNKTP